MKLDVTLKKEHTDFVTCIAWSPDGQLLSVSDDKDIIRWDSNGDKLGKILSLSAFPTSIAWFPSTGKQSQDMFAVSCTDGTVRYISKSGREEKKINAHEGAVITMKWSHDGNALCTAGEDGEVKIWSKNGNLRSTLVSLGQSVFTIAWAPDDDHMVIGNNKSLMIKSIQSNKKNLTWGAHEGLVLCCDWNLSNNLIVSGGEDCVYKVWDSYGRLLYAAKPMEHFITSVAWSPNGEYFAVGSYNMIKLCDKIGWSYTRERMQTGSVYALAFTYDNTQLASACGNGSVMIGNLIERKFEYKHLEVSLMDSKRIKIVDSNTENVEEIDIAKDRIVDVKIGYDMIIITTSSQCYIYNVSNLNTPIIFEIKASTQFIHLSNNKYFLLCDYLYGISVYTYEGKHCCSPKFPNFRPELYVKEYVALSNDLVAIVDCIDNKNIYLFDSLSGRNYGKLAHSTEVLKVYFNQSNHTAHERILAFVDKSFDLFIGNVSVAAIAHTGGGGNSTLNSSVILHKLQSHVESCLFHDTHNVLVCMSDTTFITFYHPEVVFVSRDLLSYSKQSVEQNEYGRHAQILSYAGNRVQIRKIDGSIVYATTAVDILLLDELMNTGRWDESVRLCRHQHSNVLWACLGAMAINKKQLEAAETSLAELGEVAKIEYIQYIKNIPSEEGRNAELLVFKKQYDEAERVLLQASPPLIYRLVKLNIGLFRFHRALEFAQRYKQYVDVVCYYRKKYMDGFNREEQDAKFLALMTQVRVVDEEVLRKEQEELEEEAARYGGKGGRK